MNKTVFISSTYRDLADYRRAVWGVLEGFDVAIRGMEQFGARTEAPLETCMAEVEQSDVYVGIVAFRLGSIDQQSGKSFTQLEYNRAYELGKTILIYLADKQEAPIHYADIDVDARDQARLEAFKSIIMERHTVVTFSTAEDLAEKIKTDFVKHFPLETAKAEDAISEESEFESTLALVRRFRILPKTVAGRQIRLAVAPIGKIFPASRALCNAFNLEYGRTVGIQIRIDKPKNNDMTGLREIYASGLHVSRFLSLMSERVVVDIYARLQFSPDDVPRSRGEFFGYSYYYEPEPEDPNEIYVAPEGKVILLFSKPAI